MIEFRRALNLSFGGTCNGLPAMHENVLARKEGP